MSLPINPFTLRTILIDEERTLLILPSSSDPLHTPSSKEHLQRTVERINTALKRGYSLTNTLHPKTPITSPTISHSPSIKNLTSLAQELKDWLKNNKSIIQKSFEESFYDSICNTLNEPEEPSLPSTSIALETPSTSKALLPPRKRWMLKNPQEESTIPSKKPKDTLKKSSLAITAPSPMQENPSSLASYLVKDIVMLDDSIFMLSQKQIEDLEMWMNSMQQQTAHIMNHHEILCVDPEIDAKDIHFETLASLRLFSLKSLLNFMKQHQILISSIKDPDRQNEIKLSHLQIIQDLKAGILDIENTTTSPSSTPKDSKTEALKELEGLKKAEESQRETESTTSSDNNTAPTISKQNVPESKASCYFISIKTATTSFFLSARKTFYSSTKFNNFLDYVEQASSLFTYSCAEFIPNVINEASNDPQQTLIILYYIVHRNWYCWNKASRNKYILLSIEKNIDSLLNKLNEKYCSILEIEANPLSHHSDLLKSLVSEANPPQPILLKKSISYLNVSAHPKHQDIIYISKTSLLHPVNTTKNQLYAWKKSLIQHKKRILKLLEHAKTRSIYIKCSDNSWALDHNTEKPVNYNQLLSLLTEISQNNLKHSLSYFKENTDLDEEMHYPGFKETQETFLNILEILKNPDKFLISELQHIKEKKPSLPHNYIPIFSIFRPNEKYEIKIYKVNKDRHSNAIKSILAQSKKTKRFLKIIIEQTKKKKHPQIIFDNQLITTFQDLMELVYYGFDYNWQLTKTVFKEKAYYKETIDELSSIKTLTLKEYNLLEPIKTLSPLHDLQHPLKEVLVNLYKKLQEEAQRIM